MKQIPTSTVLPHNAQVIILHASNGNFSNEFQKSPASIQEKGTQACSMHIMAAVALSELASITPASQMAEKKEVSTQTENIIPDVWMNSVQEETFNNMESKVVQIILDTLLKMTTKMSWTFQIHDSGTQTEEVDFSTVLSPDSPQNPSSPWLGLSAETQTVDEDAVLRPFNLCNIQTQTPWNEMSDDDTTELAHTETQTLLSSFFDDSNIPDCQGERSKPSFLLVKQNSEDAATDPMEIFDWKDPREKSRMSQMM